MSSEALKQLVNLLKERRMREIPEIVKLYDKFFTQAINDGSRFAFIGPGTGSEVYAMLFACQKNNVTDYEIVMVDHPESKTAALVGLPPFPLLTADYLREKDGIFSFLREHHVNTIIIRNTQTTSEHIPLLKSFIDYAKEVDGHGLITVRDSDLSPDLDRNLRNLGMIRYDIPKDIAVTERIAYVM